MTAACSAIAVVDEEQTREHTVVRGNLSFPGDPGFVDFDGMDWNLKPGSPAYRALGDMRFREMGLYASPLRVSPPVKFGEGVTPPLPFNPYATEALERGCDYEKTVRARVWLDGDPDLARRVGIRRVVVRRKSVDCVLDLEPTAEGLCDFDAFTFPGQSVTTVRDLGNMYMRFRAVDEGDVEAVDLSATRPAAVCAAMDAALRRMRSRRKSLLWVSASPVNREAAAQFRR